MTPFTCRLAAKWPAKVHRQNSDILSTTDPHRDLPVIRRAPGQRERPQMWASGTPEKDNFRYRRWKSDDARGCAVRREGAGRAEGAGSDGMGHMGGGGCTAAGGGAGRKRNGTGQG